MNPLLLSSLPDDVVVEVALYLHPSDLLRLYHTARRFATKRFVVAVARKSGVFVGHQRRITHLVLVPSSTGETKFITGAADGTVRVWNSKTMATERIFRMLITDPAGWERTDDQRETTQALVAMPDGKRFIVVMNRDNLVRVCNLEDGTTERTFEHGVYISSVALSPSGETYACNFCLTKMGRDHREAVTELYRTDTGELVQWFRIGTYLDDMAFTPDGKKIFVAGGRYNEFVVDLESGERQQRDQQNWNRACGWQGLVITGDGKKCVSIKDERTVAVWCRQTFAVTTTLMHEHPVAAVDVSNDGRWVLSGSYDHKVRLWDANDGNLLKTFEGHTNTVSVVRFFPGGKRCLSGSWDGTVRRWDLSNI